MIKKFKLCFFSFLLLFLVIPSYFFLPFFSPISSLVTSISIVQSPDDGRLKKFNQTLDIKFFCYLIMGIQQIKVIKEEKEYTYPVDLLANAITQLMLQQSKTLNVVDLDKLEGKSRQQFLDLLNNKGKFKHESKIEDNAQKQIENDLGQKYLNSFKYLLLKIQTLGIIELTHPLIKGSTIGLLGLNEIPTADLKKLTFKQLQNAPTNSEYHMLYKELVTSFTLFGFETQTVIASEINGFGNPWLHTLQKASSLGLTHLTVGKVQVDVSTLVDSKVKEASDLSLEQLQTLKKLQLLLQSWPYYNNNYSNSPFKQKKLKKFQTQVKVWVDTKLNFLDSYKTSIQSTLENFTNTKIKKIKINGVSYQVDLLLKNTNLQLSGSQLPEDAKNQLLALVETKISPQKLAQSFQDEQNILAFQKNWDTGKVSSYLFWLSLFDIEKVKLSQNQVVPVEALAIAIQTMLSVEKFDFTKLQEKARKQLLNLLDVQGRIRAEKTFQDDVWKQIKNHQKWKAIEGSLGELVLQSIKTLLLEVQDLGISKVSHPFFPRGYDLSFLKDDESWKEISFKDLLQGMKVAVNGTHIEFYSHLFPNQVVFQVPMKKLSTVFSEITITNIITALEKVISDYPQQERKLETKNQGLIIGLSVVGSVFVFIVLGCFIHLFLKMKRSRDRKKLK